MLAYTVYERDNRVRRYAETLAALGHRVTVIALCGDVSPAPGCTVFSGVTLYTLQERKHNERSEWTYLLRLVRFLVSSSVLITRLHRRRAFDLVHVHNIPDFLVFAAWYPKWRGAKVILDIHDLVPELFAAKFRSRFGSLYISILKQAEKRSARFADHVIIANHLWFDTVTKRSVSARRCSVVLNNVDLRLFERRPRTRHDDRIIVLFPGSLQWHQGVDLAIEAFADVVKAIPNAQFHIFGGSGGDQRAPLESLVQRLQLSSFVKFFPGVPLDAMPQLIANSDLGIVPKRDNGFGNEAYSTKTMEFMSQGVPVVVARTKIDSYYLEEGIVHFFQPGDVHAMATAMIEAIHDSTLRAALIANGLEYCRKNSWSAKQAEYLSLIDRLLAARGTDGRASGYGNLEQFDRIG